MKAILLLLILIFSSNLFASAHYDILIDKNGYALKMNLIFDHYQNLSSIRHALVKSEILSQLSPNVKSVTNTGTLEEYDSLMVVKSFGIKSELLSHCKESFSDKTWSRNCSLQTDKLDSGKYMVWKTDQVICTKNSEKEIECQFSINGKTKPLKILGIELLTDRAFAVKAKVQALNNFFKIYYFVNTQNTSVKIALEDFDKSKAKVELDQFESDAIKKLKNKLSYTRSFQLQELK